MITNVEFYFTLRLQYTNVTMIQTLRLNWHKYDTIINVLRMQYHAYYKYRLTNHHVIKSYYLVHTNLHICV